MNFNNNLSHQDIRLQIMQQKDFNDLFEVAKDPQIWDQHDAKDRFTLDGFRKYFEEGIANPENCYLIFYKNELVGSTRYYEYDLKDSSIKIGYTFYAKKYWGTPLNRIVKKLMLDYAFKYVDKIYFDVWTENFRSQKALEKLGAKLYKIDHSRQRLIFLLNKEGWK
jgi:RimJ/RimL family protein N-acetyltransferase